MEIYLEENNINHIPKILIIAYQGAVESFNKTIQVLFDIS